MPDTNRARTALETLFADNTAGDISAQDLRDFLRSVKLLNVPGEQTGASYTFALADADLTVVFNSASAQAITIPTNASVAFPIGTRIRCYRKGAGLPTISPDSGVTLNKPTGIRPNRFMGASVKKAADQTTANYTAFPNVAWDAEVYDTDAFHDTVTNNSRLTIPASLGITKIRLDARISASSFTADTFMAMQHFKAGVAFAGQGGIVIEMGGTQPSGGASTGPISATAADYFEVNLGSESDTSITVEAIGSWFSLEVLEIDPVGTIAYRYGYVVLEKIGTNEWNIEGPALG